MEGDAAGDFFFARAPDPAAAVAAAATVAALGYHRAVVTTFRASCSVVSARTLLRAIAADRFHVRYSRRA